MDGRHVRGGKKKINEAVDFLLSTPSRKTLEMLGMDPDAPDDDFFVDYDTHEALMVWGHVSTQWRCSNGYLTGLDYNCLPLVFDLCGVKPENRYTVFNSLRYIEQHVMLWHNENKAA